MAALTPWFRRRLQSCGPGSNLNHTIYAFSIWIVEIETAIDVEKEKNENKQQEANIGLNLFKNSDDYLGWIFYGYLKLLCFLLRKFCYFHVITTLAAHNQTLCLDWVNVNSD